MDPIPLAEELFKKLDHTALKHQAHNGVINHADGKPAQAEHLGFNIHFINDKADNAQTNHWVMLPTY